MGAESSEAGYLGVRRLLARRDRPAAYFCYHDLTAYGAMEALKESGLRIPEGASVVGFDDIFSSRHLELTTLAQPWREMGRLAANILLEHLTGTLRVAELRVAPELLVRGTTGPCRTIDTQRS